MKRLWFILCFLPLIGFGQAIQRQFFTTNTAPWVLISAGTNSFVTYHLLGGQTNQFVIDVPTVGGSSQSNDTFVAAGSNVTVTTNVAAGHTLYTVSAIGQTNLALVVSGTNIFVTPTTNNGVTTFTVDGPALRTQWAITDITNSLNLTNWALLPTNTFLNKAGDTSTGPQLTTSSTSNSPSATEFATAGWVRSLLNNGFFEYASTNIISGTNADSPNQFLYAFQSTIPDSAVRVWASAFLTNNGYVGSVATTNTFQSLAGTVVINAYMGLSSGGGDALSIKPEIYLSSDRTQWYGDFDCQPQVLTPGRTNLYTFVVTFPSQTATNIAGFYVERRLKVTSVGGTPTLTFLVGTNAVSGTNNASHMVINAAPVQGGTFTGTFIGNGAGLTNLFWSNIVSGGSIQASIFDAQTNAWAMNTDFPLGATNYYLSQGAATGGITGLATRSTSTARWLARCIRRLA